MIRSKANSSLLLLVPALACVAPSGCAETSQGDSATSFRAGEDGGAGDRLGVLASGHAGAREWHTVTGSVATAGPVSLATQHQMTGVIRALQREGLVELPDCAGLPDVTGEEGDDPVPLQWFQGLRGSPDAGYEIDVPIDPECEPGVPAGDPGNIDPHQDSTEVQFEASRCTESDNGMEQHSLICQYVHELDPFEDPRNIYPASHADLFGRYEIDVEQECEGLICDIWDMSIEPIDPMEEELTEPIEADCDLVPELCELTVEILDRTDLLIEGAHNPNENETVHDESDEECVEVIAAYNSGDVACSHRVAECAYDGNCRSDTEDSYTECSNTGAGDDCLTCEGKGESLNAECADYSASVEDSTDEMFSGGERHPWDEMRAETIAQRSSTHGSGTATTCKGTDKGPTGEGKRLFELTCTIH